MHASSGSYLSISKIFPPLICKTNLGHLQHYVVAGLHWWMTLTNIMVSNLFLVLLMLYYISNNILHPCTGPTLRIACWDTGRDDPSRSGPRNSSPQPVHSKAPEVMKRNEQCSILALCMAFTPLFNSKLCNVI